MTVGGRTIGNATAAWIAGFSLESLRDNHQANGVPSAISIKVVTAASCSDNNNGPSVDNITRSIPANDSHDAR